MLWDPLKKLFIDPNKPRVLREFFESENSEPMLLFLSNVLKTFEEPILSLQVQNFNYFCVNKSENPEE